MFFQHFYLKYEKFKSQYKALTPVVATVNTPQYLCEREGEDELTVVSSSNSEKIFFVCKKALRFYFIHVSNVNILSILNTQRIQRENR